MKRQDLLRVSLDSETNVQYDTPYKLVIYGTTELTDMSYFQTQWIYLMAEKVQVDFHQDFWEVNCLKWVSTIWWLHVGWYVFWNFNSS